MRKIAVTTTSFCEYDNAPLRFCREKGYKVALNSYRRKLKPDELISLAKDAAGLIAGTESISEEVLLRLTQLRVISRCGAGIDNINIEAAKRLGVKVFNTPAAPTQAVAELTIGLMLSLLRKINQIDALVRAGAWEKPMGSLLSGKRVGIIGFGRTGKRVAGLLKPFSCEVRFVDPRVKSGLLGYRKMPIERLLGWADIVSIHASAKDMIIGRHQLKAMRKSAFLINVSRGTILDENALYDYLKRGLLAGAALDVFNDEPYQGKLRVLKNTILTTHIGSYAKEARVAMEFEAVKNVIKGLEE